MSSLPNYPESENKFVCFTPQWGSSFVGQQAVVSLLAYPSNVVVPLFSKHAPNPAQVATKIGSQYEYLYDFFQVF
jgi:hypothetical protein